MYLPSQNKQTNKQKGISQKQNKGSFEFCLSTLSLHTQLTERVVHFYILPFTFPFHLQTLYSLASVWNPSDTFAKITNSNRLAMSQSLPGWLSPGHPAPLMTHSLEIFNSLPSRTLPLLLHLTLTLCPTHCSSSSILPLNSGELQISITRPFLFTSAASLLRLRIPKSVMRYSNSLLIHPHIDVL